jgi:hypothetical protein
MFLAFRSRKMNFGQVSEIYKEIFRYFVKHPLKFFFHYDQDWTKKQMI